MERSYLFLCLQNEYFLEEKPHILVDEHAGRGQNVMKSTAEIREELTSRCVDRHQKSVS